MRLRNMDGAPKRGTRWEYRVAAIARASWPARPITLVPGTTLWRCHSLRNLACGAQTYSVVVAGRVRGVVPDRWRRSVGRQPGGGTRHAGAWHCAARPHEPAPNSRTRSSPDPKTRDIV